MLGRIEAPLVSASPIEPPSHHGFRGVSVLFALFLAVFCLWLVFAELWRPRIDRLPTDRESAELAAGNRNEARRAAEAGIVRGDLWAEAAFTFADLLWAGSDAQCVLKSALEEARISFGQAIRFAPNKAGVWLLAADLGLRCGWSSPNPAEALRMSYYTGPNEMALMPLRAELAAQMPALEADLQQLAERDLRLLLAHQQKPAIVRAYEGATGSGKHLIEEAIGTADPALVDALRRGAAKLED